MFVVFCVGVWLCLLGFGLVFVVFLGFVFVGDFFVFLGFALLVLFFCV